MTVNWDRVILQLRNRGNRAYARCNFVLFAECTRVANDICHAIVLGQIASMPDASDNAEYSAIKHP